MKLKFLLAALVFTAAALPPARAADAPPSAPAPAASAKKPETELEGRMKKIGGAFRKLRRQASDPAKNADSLEQVGIMHENAEAATKLTPAKASTIPEADRAKWVSDYQAKMKEMVGELDKLAAAFKENRNEDAVKIVQSLGAMQKEGHSEYRAKDD